MSMRGRGRGARGGGGSGGGVGDRRGSWRGGPPGSAGYTRPAATGNSSVRPPPPGSDFPRRPSTGSAGAPRKDDKGKGFQTDADISGNRGGERELKPWAAEADPGLGPNGAAAARPSDPRDTITFGGPINSTPWDQFETNERLFGAKTDYDEELYTTKLDRGSTGYKRREREADRLAQEIMTKTSSNPHVAEERNQTTPGDTKDDEEKYSGVARNPNAYVPPGARKPGSKPGKDKEEVVAPAAKSNGAAQPAAPAPEPAITEPPTADGAPRHQTPSPVPGPAQRSSADPAVDPAIASASLGPGPAPAMTRSTSAVPQSGQTNGPMSMTPVPVPPIGAVVDQARQFVVSERERVTQRKQSMAKNERAHLLADFKSWQASFKVPLAMPKDILPILTKDEQKQKEIEARAEKERTEASLRQHDVKSPTAQATASGGASSKAMLSPDPGAKGLQQQQQQAAAAQKKIPMKIPEIPPFRKKQATAVPVPVPETAAQNIALVTSPTLSNASITSGAAAAAKLNPKASAFVFKPTAAAFQPGGPSPATVGSPAAPPAATLAPAPVTSAANSPGSQSGKLPAPSTPGSSSKPQNPFYRDGPPKRILPNPREDFNPFKHGQVPSASTIAPQWPYTGRRSSVAFAVHPMHMNMSPNQASTSQFEDNPGSPHSSHAPPPMIGVPPNLMPFYRYQPGMPQQVQGGMPGMMFQGPGGFMPPQMGSPHLGGPQQQGPNGMPMYFANGMPPNAHFLPPQMHFHPNGPGRPGPQGPMFYQGGNPGQHQAPQMQPNMSQMSQMSYSGPGQPTPPQPHFQQPLPAQGFEGSPGG